MAKSKKGKSAVGQRRKERMANYHWYRTSAVPTKSTLLQGVRDKKYVVFRDTYGRLYFVADTDGLRSQWYDSREVFCYSVLASRYPKDGEDERGSILPDTGEKITLMRGKNGDDGDDVMAFIYEPQAYPKRVTGTAVLWLPEGLPS